MHNAAWAKIMNGVLTSVMLVEVFDQTHAPTNKQRYYLAAVAVIGGYIEGLHIGGLVKVFSNGQSGASIAGSDNCMSLNATYTTQPSGIVVDMKHGDRAIEIAILDNYPRIKR